MPAKILSKPADDLAPGVVGVYKVAHDNWGDFALLLEELSGERVSVKVKDGPTFTFETARERMSWADGFKQGIESSQDSERTLAWLEAFLAWKLAEEDDKEDRLRVMDLRAEKLVQKDRAASLVANLKSWMRGLSMRSNTKAEPASSATG